MTPKTKVYLNKKKADLPKLYELLARKNKLENDIAKSETGIEMNNVVSEDLIALALVKEFAKEMLNVP